MDFIKLFKIIILLSLLGAYRPSFSHSETGKFTGWDLGMNFGFYVPAAYHARFYDGSATNVNHISYVFGNKYYYDQIRNSLNSSDTFFITGMPSNMRYTSTFSVGLYFRRTFENKLGIAMEFNFSKLKAEDFFQIQVDPNIILTEPDLRLFPIWGMEERVNINLLFSKYFPSKNSLYVPFFEAGLNINSTRVTENKIKINDLEYSIVDVYLSGSYVPGVQQTQYDIRQGGIDLGLAAGGGVKLVFNKNISIDPGIQLLYQKIKLEAYERFKPGLVFFVRLSLAGFFANNE